ncbi:hypothetical protein U8Q05_20455 [Rhizobium ruizarguesonis]|nr:hypothetical protein U8Q05_20455 [Rhizobium ruizarguesonis]
MLTIFAPDLSKILHTFGMPAPPSDMLFDVATSALDPKLVGEVLDTMPIPSIEPADGGRRLMERIVEIGQVVMIARRSSVASGPARLLVIERGVGSDTLK